ncbi:Gfo/Idh/MocA family protein [Chloroflexota bacterium]
MKLLIIGCGSIGRRHAQNAKSLGAEIVLCDLDESRMQKTCTELGKVPCYIDYTQAVDHEGVDAAVVATPTFLHIEMATHLAMQGVHMLLEKPLSNSLVGTDKLLHIVNQNRVTAMMGHSYRFHEGLLKLQGLLNECAIGKIYHVCSRGGWYLPDWHIHEDYRREYAARQSLGGGVALISLSHSFDTFRWLFGEIQEIIGWKARLSDLPIDVDDSAFCLLRTTQGMTIACIADFLSRCPSDEMILIGSEGHIETDLPNNLLKLWQVKDKRFAPGDPRIADIPGRIKILDDGVQYDPEPEIINYEFNRNHRYLAEMAYFFDRIRAGEVQFDLDLRSGIRVVELINDIRFQYVS